MEPAAAKDKVDHDEGANDSLTKQPVVAVETEEPSVPTTEKRPQ